MVYNYEVAIIGTIDCADEPCNQDIDYQVLALNATMGWLNTQTAQCKFPFTFHLKALASTLF